MAGTQITGADFAGFTEGSSVTTYGRSNQSKVWWNASQSRWDGVLPDSTYDHFIFADITAGTADKRLELEDRSSGRVDCYWDETNDKLYVASNHTTAPEFFRCDYTSGTDTYAMGAGSERAGVALDAAFASDGTPDEDFCISVFKSVLEDNRVWVGILNPTGLHVGWSDDDGATWGSTDQVELVASPGAAGATAFFEFSNGGNNYIGVCAVEDAAATNAEGYCFYIDQATTSVNLRTAGNWTNDSSGNCDYATLNTALSVEHDNHLSVVTDGNGKLYWLSKTGGDTLVMFERTAAGTWTGPTEVKNSTNTPSRCSVSYDSTNDEIYICYGLQGLTDMTGVYKKASAVSGLSAASETTIFSASAKDFANIYTPQARVTSTSNLMIIMGQHTDEKIYYNELSIAAAAASSSDVNFHGTNRGVLRGVNRGIG